MFRRGIKNIIKLRHPLAMKRSSTRCLSCLPQTHTQLTQRHTSQLAIKGQQNCRMLATIQNESETQLDGLLDNAVYERVCGETLDALCDYFEEIVEDAYHLVGSDVSYGDGVLTIKFGPEYGTYVINRQTPNRQIWLSSPTSGPKRYDFVGSKTGEHGKWLYKHNNESLHQLLQQEIPLILSAQNIDFLQLPYGSS